MNKYIITTKRNIGIFICWLIAVEEEDARMVEM